MNHNRGLEMECGGGGDKTFKNGPIMKTDAVVNGHSENGDYHTNQVHVEVCQKTGSTVQSEVIKEHVVRHLQQHNKTLNGEDFTIREFSDDFLTTHVQSISICDTDLYDYQGIDLDKANLQIHVFQLHDDGPSAEELDDEDLAAANHWLLPCAEFDGLWNNLVFDSHIKQQLIQYARTTLLFSDRKVDSNVISWNRVILLHGPPGTGKTSLCKALAQKLCINLSERYRYGQLVEINSHSLFSKWFSESGKLVMKMFQKIQELIDDRDSLVCVLIDEVESLTAARKSSISGSDPSDAIRVVNALLTQIDQIKRNPNVLILTTSNITGAIDLAFVDRADIKQYIGPPSSAAIFKILHSCISELVKTSIIQPIQPLGKLLNLRELEVMGFVDNKTTRLSLKLRHISTIAYGLSGRTLRKLPFIAHAVFVQTPTVTMEVYLEALEKAVLKQFQEIKELSNE
ncbi:pachytene checkpoint protein 2 homolog [Tubulanus polymorphus]|uniref:pachytene checkpoint protein 2 homolog n=1 Tax=Tubulanus polymorphus TaxID=672921 RepID=UPI003DA38D23